MKFLQYLKNSSGNVTMMLAFAIVPMALSAGAAIDIMRQNSTQTLLQAAADAAILAGGASKAPTDAQAKQIVLDFVSANGGLDAVKSISNLDVTANTTTGIYTVNIKGQIDTGFMYLAGIPTMNVGAYAEITVPYQGAEIALVLDNTASMASEGRLDALKLAAKNLVTTVLSKKQASTYVKIGIVPFADYVDVGMANRNASWMNVPADSTSVNPNVCDVSYPNASSSNCHDAQGVWNNDGVATPYTYQVCDWVMGNPTTTCGPQTVTHKWFGCVGSRNSPMDRGIGNSSTPYPGIQDTGCTAEITLLTDNQTTLNSAIDSMVAVGNTYIPAGLLWGWNLLDANEPITGAKSKAAMTAMRGTKTMVLMTDGDNTLSPGTGADYKYHWGTDVAQANTITAALCDNIKQDGINLYTVAFKVTNPTSKSLLESCASNSTQAFDAANDADLQAAFQTIADNLAALRLSK